MSAPLKYASFLALGLALGFCIHARPNLEEIAKLTWLDEITVIINKAVAAVKPQAADFAVDPTAAARVDEDLDYRIAERIGSVEAWRSFLTVHGSGVRAQTAMAEVKKLLFAERASEPGAANVSNGAASEVAPPTLSPDTEVATFAPDDICKRDEDRLERLRNNPTSDEALRFANELGCETLRPQLLRLMGSLDPAASALAGAEVSNAASRDARVVSEPAPPAPPSPNTEVADLTPDDICKRDGDRLQRLRSNPTSDEAAHFANQLGCEKLRPQLLRLMESLGHDAPPSAAAPPRPAAKVGSAGSPKSWAVTHASSTRSVASSQALKPRRRVNHCAFRFACFSRPPVLLPVLLALLGERPKNSTEFAGTVAHARPNASGNR